MSNPHPALCGSRKLTVHSLPMFHWKKEKPHWYETASFKSEWQLFVAVHQMENPCCRVLDFTHIFSSNSLLHIWWPRKARDTETGLQGFSTERANKTAWSVTNKCSYILYCFLKYIVLLIDMHVICKHLVKYEVSLYIFPSWWVPVLYRPIVTEHSKKKKDFRSYTMGGQGVF